MSDDIYGELRLRHSGVKGMKWGVRKKRTSSKNSLSSLSNKDLQKVITRSNLEKNYRATQVSTGKKVVKGALATIGLTVVANYTSNVIPKAIVSTINTTASKLFSAVTG